MNLNKERNDEQMRRFYSEVPLNRQLSTRSLVHLVTSVSTVSQYHLESILQFVSDLIAPILNEGVLLAPNLTHHDDGEMDYNFDDSLYIDPNILHVNLPDGATDAPETLVHYSPTAAAQRRLLFAADDVDM